jgi:hypothetical protein
MTKLEIIRLLITGGQVVKTFYIHHASIHVVNGEQSVKITQGQLNKLLADQLVQFDRASHGGFTKHYYTKI